ncbi:cohesin subunit [Maudiozyma humilis]|uniref:Structural maintenance of chromosomes protein n=1 Tax=Maudiozyma humilis TaxID=51915 RepID=A0AAV5RR03_MAUHU|nr:cohesin subunit [Kazachstania humilis]
MGRLLGLELHNFKSYSGTVSVGFGDASFTSIIGPNGSGKSNMMDAISFVLGVRSANLRSSAARDLVYRGVRTDSGSDISSSGDAAATTTTLPATSAYVKAFYNDNNRTVTLQRSIETSGDSHYSIDGKTVPYSDFAAYLESQNVLVRAKNFLVFQGDVEQLAQQRPRDLSRLLEQISGSAALKQQYDDLQEQRDALAAGLADKTRARRRVHAELQTFEEGIAQDDAYKAAVAAKRLLQRHYALWQLFHLDRRRAQLDDAAADAARQVSDLDRLHAAEQRNLQRARKLAARDGALCAKARAHADAIAEERDALRTREAEARAPQGPQRKRIATAEKRIESLQRDVDRQREYVARSERQLGVVTAARDAYKHEVLQNNAHNGTRFTLSPEDRAEYERLNAAFLAEGGAALEERIQVLENDTDETNDELYRLRARVDDARHTVADEMQLALENNEQQHAALTATLNDKNALLTEHVARLKDVQGTIESSSNREYDLNYKLRETLVRIDDLSATQRETLREKKTRENAAMLKRFFPGVRGLVHDLCRPKKDRYATAVSTVLGRNFDSIVVDSSATAQECISYLKKQRAGAASFIPLDTIEAEVASLPVSGGSGYLLAINAIDYDAEYERAMQYVCSNTIVCDTLDIAKQLKWQQGVRAKLVTLDGAYIHRAGLMTGGTSKNQNNRWDKEEYQSLLTLKDKLLQDIEDLSAANMSASLQARELEGVIAVLNTEISTTRVSLTQIGRAIDENKVEIEHQNNLIDGEYTPKIEALEAKKQQLEMQSREAQREREQLQETVYKEFTDRLGFTIKEYESRSGELLRKQNKELQQLQREIMNVENKLQFETERLATTEKRLERAQSDLEKANDELRALQDNQARIKAQIEDNLREEEEQTAKIAEMQKAYDAKQLELTVTENRLSELELSTETHQRQIDNVGGDDDKIELERVGILQNCKVSGIPIPVTSETDLDDLPIAQIDEETLDISEKLAVDYSELPKKYKGSNSQTIRTKFIAGIKDVEDKLCELQPNARAAERYKEAQDRYKEANKEVSALKTQEAAITKRFLSVKRERKKLFDKAFDHVSEHLNGIYKELTRDPNLREELSGGHASLTLEDEDEPFNAGIRYHATPPLKRFKDMEYLSGGEKTIAALALLFAVNSFHPSPFFVLDEVDAALDVTNVERIATYIRRHGNPELQFIVISLKNSMFEKSDALVGVYRQPQANASRVVTLDLQGYPDK